MSLVLFGDPLHFHTLLLSLLSSFDSPLLGKMRSADFGLPLLVLSPRHSDFFELDFFTDKSSFLPIDVWIELS
jgi:hypothetical protein